MFRTALLTGLGSDRWRKTGSYRRRRPRRTASRLQEGGLLLAVTLSLTGCSTARFYAQAVRGQLELVHRAEPIGPIIGDPDTPPELRRKLSLVGDICRFAETELHLEVGRSYTKYADLGREHIVWCVFAAPKYSLRPKTWDFPLVGKMSYRGFFSEHAAEASAKELGGEGYDVYVAGAGAYSTLGYFADPVLNTFIDERDTSIAELIFHELAHRRLYRKDQTAFNESFANAVAQEGVRRWLRSKGDEAPIALYEKRLKRRAEIVQEFARSRKQLAELYSSGIPEAAMDSKKKATFEALQTRIRALFRKWGSEAPEEYVLDIANNARMNATATYHDLVRFFEVLLAKNGGNLEAFYKASEKSDL